MSVLLLPLLASFLLGLSDLPEPLVRYVEPFDQQCRQSGQGQLVANDMYVDKLFGVDDANQDGIPDFFAYACMFGCTNSPYAFASGSPPCPDGVLLLSEDGGHVMIRLPGTIKTIIPGKQPRIVVTRRRNIGDGCTLPFGCQYVYEVKGGRFQLVRACPDNGC